MYNWSLWEEQTDYSLTAIEGIAVVQTLCFAKTRENKGKFKAKIRGCLVTDTWHQAFKIFFERHRFKICTTNKQAFYE